MFQLDWDATLNVIRETSPGGKRWFNTLEFIRCDNNAVVLGVPSRFHEEWIREHYHEQIRHAITNQVGTEVQLEFVLVEEQNRQAAAQPQTGIEVAAAGFAPPELEARVEVPHASVSQPVVEAPTPLAEEAPKCYPPPVLPPFNNTFYELQFNHVAFQCAAMFAEGKDSQLNPLMIQGGIGMGKTHLLAQLGREIYQKNPGLRIQYTSAESFGHEYVRALRSNQIFEFKKKYADETDVLLFDDIHGMANKKGFQESLLHIYNDILARGGRIAFTSTLSAHKLENFLEPLKSRLMAGLTAEIKPVMFEEKVELLTRWARQNAIEIDGPAVRSLADKGQKDVRELLGSLLRVHVQAHLENKALDDAFLTEDRLSRGEQPKVRITLDDILSQVEVGFGVYRSDMCSKSRKGAIVWARQVAMYLARTYTELSLEAIGQAFGRDHATVIHAYQRVCETLEGHPTRRFEVDFLKKKLESALRTDTP